MLQNCEKKVLSYVFDYFPVYTALCPKDPPFEVGIVRQFTFSSSLQCMSVVTRTLGEDHMVLYAKGAPEKIISLCQPHTGDINLHNAELICIDNEN